MIQTTWPISEPRFNSKVRINEMNHCWSFEPGVRYLSAITWFKPLQTSSVVTMRLLSIFVIDRKRKIESYVVKRVAAGAHLLTLAFWACETPKRCIRLLPGLQFTPLVQAPGTRFHRRVDCGPMGEHWPGFGPVNIPSELGRLAVPINFLVT